ncbi:MAG: CcmD family protein [Ignavibacteriaceae bacterium]|nr:CcmD family protein [Ignavibacteriaceae bacterium]NUM71555.1 CcmD family protein [Ignavibacteriaceae bacterium]
MTDFLSNNSLYIVMIIVLITWTGIFTFLMGLDKRLKKLQKELKEQENE